VKLIIYGFTVKWKLLRWNQICRAWSFPSVSHLQLQYYGQLSVSQ
jgi:hypothetical protein